MTCPHAAAPAEIVNSAAYRAAFDAFMALPVVARRELMAEFAGLGEEGFAVALIARMAK